MARQVAPGEKHFTASVIIVSEENPKRVLLVHHKKHNNWLQPGGHIEQFENPIETAIRETKEETGIDIAFLKEKIQKIDDFASSLPIPDFILEETIPAYNIEPQHFHIDLFYIVRVPFQEVSFQEKESHGIGWFTLEGALQLPMYENTKVLLRKVMDK